MTANLQIHPLALAIPEMMRDEYVELVADIKANGLREPIVLFEEKILDGRHRYRACEELRITPATETFNGTTAQAKLYVVSLNVHRRHLTLAQKEALVLAELKRDPMQSDRAAAKKAGLSPTKAGKIRKEAEAKGELSTVDSSTGLDGKVRPRERKPAPKAPPITPSDVVPTALPSIEDTRLVIKATTNQVEFLIGRVRLLSNRLSSSDNAKAVKAFTTLRETADNALAMLATQAEAIEQLNTSIAAARAAQWAPKAKGRS